MRIFFVKLQRWYTASSSASSANSASVHTSTGLAAAQSALPSSAGRADCGSSDSCGSSDTTTSHAMPSSVALFSTAFSSSTSASIVNMRLTPSTGFMCSSFGSTRSSANTGPACRNSVNTPTAAIGSSTTALRPSSVSRAWWASAGAACTNGVWATCSARSINAASCWPA